MTTLTRSLTRGIALTAGTALLFGSGLAGAAAEPLPLDPIATETTLSIDSPLSMAGIGTGFDATVSAPGCTTELTGDIVLSVGSIWSETLEIMSSEDCTATVGLYTAEIPAGQHRMVATFVPSDAAAFVGSASAPTIFEFLRWDTRLTATAPATLRAGEPLRVVALLETIAPEWHNPDYDVQYPWGVIQASVGGKVLASDDNQREDSKEGPVTLDLGVLPAGTHTVTLNYLPSRDSLEVSETTLQVTVTESAKPAPKKPVQVHTGR